MSLDLHGNVNTCYYYYFSSCGESENRNHRCLVIGSGNSFVALLLLTLDTSGTHQPIIPPASLGGFGDFWK